MTHAPLGMNTSLSVEEKRPAGLREGADRCTERIRDPEPVDVEVVLEVLGQDVVVPEHLDAEPSARARPQVFHPCARGSCASSGSEARPS